MCSEDMLTVSPTWEVGSMLAASDKSTVLTVGPKMLRAAQHTEVGWPWHVVMPAKVESDIRTGLVPAGCIQNGIILHVLTSTSRVGVKKRTHQNRRLKPY